MSLRIKKTMGIRSNSRNRDFNKKYIFVFEGEKTEKHYFENLSNYKSELGINDLIHIEILALIDECFIDNEHGKNIEKFIGSIGNLIIDKDIDINILIEDIKNLKQSLDYDDEIDEVCIIIDRDKASFKKEQYEEVVVICEENNYNLGISNPCFEFWLLLHLSDCKEYDKEDIRINRKISKSRNSKRFLEKELAIKLGGSYNKSNLKFDQFKDCIGKAINNEKLYEMDVVKLENHIGTRVGLIIEKMIIG